MNHNNKGSRSMMWMMVICCGLFLLVILLVGAGGLAGLFSGSSAWIVIGAIVLMFVAHMFMMRKGHGHDHGYGDRNSSLDEPSEKVDEKNVDEKKADHKKHSCCH